MSYERVNWTNSSVTPLTADNLNTMDAGIKNIDENMTALKSVFGNTIATLAQFIGCTSCVKTNKNFTSIANWRTYVASSQGSFEAVDKCLEIDVTANSDFSIFADLTKIFSAANAKSINADTFLVKATLYNYSASALTVRILVGSTNPQARYNVVGKQVLCGNGTAISDTSAYTWNVETNSKAEIYAVINLDTANVFQGSFNICGIGVTNNGSESGILDIARFDVFNCMD